MLFYDDFHNNLIFLHAVIEVDHDENLNNIIDTRRLLGCLRRAFR